jgi:hypothetical protein
VRFRVRVKFRALGVTLAIIERAFDVLDGSVVEISGSSLEWGMPSFDRAGVTVWILPI